MPEHAIAIEPVGAGAERSFFLWAAGYCVVLVFVGFTPTYLGPLATSATGEYTPVVHLHGALFFSWTLLFFFQTWLIARGRVATHRAMGLLGTSLATAMVIIGFIVSLAANVARFESGQVARAYDLGFSNTTALLGFAVLFGLAVAKRRDAAAHKRLILFATCMILTPAVGRLYRPVFAPDPPLPWLVFLTIDVLLVACLVHDFRTLKRPHPVSLGCGAALLPFQVLRFPVPGMTWWQSTYDAVIAGFSQSVGG